MQRGLLPRAVEALKRENARRSGLNEDLARTNRDLVGAPETTVYAICRGRGFDAATVLGTDCADA